jgi:hypothetical protein
MNDAALAVSFNYHRTPITTYSSSGDSKSASKTLQADMGQVQVTLEILKNLKAV